MIEDIDEATSALIAQLTLQDITEISGARKGKGRSDVAKSDEEYALDLQADYWRMELDLQLAQSLSRALETDANWLAVEQAAEDDHRYALALSNGAELPAQSANQSLLENPAFVRTLFTPSSPNMATNANVTNERDLITTGTSTPLSTRPPSPSTSSQCVICGDRLRAQRSFRAPCEDQYCHGCLRDLVQASINDESLYPVRCCGRPLVERDFLPLLPFSLRTRFQIKSRELGTPAMSRVYCQNPICSAFLGSSEGRDGEHAVCPLCKQNAHRGKNCVENAAIQDLHALARDQRWQTCPGCHSIIELNHGCYHMTCRCLTQFCYVCAVPWKNCHCPQWDEDRLYITAQRRVEEEMGPRATAAAPDIFQREVAARAEQLRSNHDCVRHSWRRRNGGARCEECSWYLREYLLVCTHCGLAACVRCCRNRLL
ncbi:uncharacterized protein EV420DRAFT_1561491 [Desarmillaria tabescens]|uniref:RBR-type E3 ubiquitin transferase n=1 Tax=Armillaria tabescens TaxID=1929756 RepID=A0AA39JYD7_ARMTA|nr:uncharacterized protein EV420DRAFT_1561491 [Desarmillaria tabescens]KAK0451210.1 hypothetical protein EV420DRAFT_1561491 [Desarmillaria tabescens]